MIDFQLILWFVYFFLNLFNIILIYCLNIRDKDKIKEKSISDKCEKILSVYLLFYSIDHLFI